MLTNDSMSRNVRNQVPNHVELRRANGDVETISEDAYGHSVQAVKVSIGACYASGMILSVTTFGDRCANYRAQVWIRGERDSFGYIDGSVAISEGETPAASVARTLMRHMFRNPFCREAMADVEVWTPVA